MKKEELQQTENSGSAPTPEISMLSMVRWDEILSSGRGRRYFELRLFGW